MFFRVNHFILPAYLLPLFCPSQSNRIKDFSFCVPCRRGLPAASDAFRQTYSTFRYCITLFGLDWFGLDWFGLDWFGLDWIGLVLPSRVFSGILGYAWVCPGMRHRDLFMPKVPFQQLCSEISCNYRNEAGANAPDLLVFSRNAIIQK